METSRPRMRSGATSAMYIGERLEARPIATPPDIRQARNTANVPAIPVPIELTVNRNAERTSRRFLPNLSLSMPEASAPNRQPISALLIASATMAGGRRRTNVSENGFAPPITTQSYPNSSPPMAAAIEMNQMYRKLYEALLAVVSDKF